jgi:RNA polymerase sigma-70 factor (ECF subfamily)
MNRGSAHGEAALQARRLGRDRETPPITVLDPETDHVLAGRAVSLRNALARYFQRRVQDASEVDDLVQEVFLRIVRRGDAGELEKLEGYVFKTAASVLADRARRRKVRQADRHIPFEPDFHAGEAPGPERTLIGLETLETIGVALLELPERTRRVFILRRIEGLSASEIARRLGVSPTAVDKHMLKAVRHILARTRDDR